jgi:hypothetical protein
MIKGQHVVRACRTSLSSPCNHAPLPLSDLHCPYHATTLTSISRHKVHISTLHTSRYIDFQITKLKKYVQDGTPISSNGYDVYWERNRRNKRKIAKGRERIGSLEEA